MCKHAPLHDFVVLNDSTIRMPLVGAWCKVWIYFGFVFAWSKGARPRFDTSTDMGLVLVPADAEIDSVIFRLRATDQDADFPLVFEITATITPVVRIDNLPCTLYNKVCQANVILTKRLIPGRLHDFAVRVKDSKGDSNSMQATISVTNATTPRDKIFPHIPSLIMVPEDTKPGKELDYLLVRANSWSGKPVYIELWQPKELFTIRQRQTPTQTRGIITLIGELDFETQSMYTLTMYATDPYTEPGKDTRNIAGLNVVVVVQDVQDVPPIFTLAPPLTRINNSVQPGDIILRVHAEDGDKGVPREIAYGLVSEGNPFTPFFNISETTGEIVLAKPLDELTQITHVGAPVVLTVVAEEIRRNTEEPPAQATVVEVGFLLGEPGNSPPYFESDNYVVTIDENPDPGTVITFGEHYVTRVRDEDIGKAGVFALKLENNNGTFEINPTVAERTADFIITVRDNTLIDYELYKSLSFKIIAQEVGPATNLSAMVPVTIFLRDINDNAPVFEQESYEVTLSENVTAGTRVIQVHATDKDTGVLGSIRYTDITGDGSDAFTMDPDTGLITVSMGSSLDREIAPRLLLSVEARDESGKGNKGVVPLTVNLLDVNDNAPLFEKDVYEFSLNSDLTNFTAPAFIKAIDADAEPPNNEVRYELVHGNYESKFHLNEITGELTLRSPITKVRRKKQSAYENFANKNGKELVRNRDGTREFPTKLTTIPAANKSHEEIQNTTVPVTNVQGVVSGRRKRDNDGALYTLTARAYDLGVPHMSSVTQVRVLSGAVMEARIMMFVVPGEHPDSTRTAETLAAITGGRVTVLEMRPYIQQNVTAGGSVLPGGGKKSIVVARIEQTEPGTPLVDVEKIRDTLAASGVGVIHGTEIPTDTVTNVGVTKRPDPGGTQNNNGQTTNINNTIIGRTEEEVTAYRAENKLLFWLLIILGLLMLLAIAALIICCICPGCPFYMAPRKRRVHSSETIVIREDGRPKRHLHRKPAAAVDVTWNGRKQAWSADPSRRNWRFNRRNTKNCGLASLPGDVAYISGQQNDVQVNVEPLRLRDGPAYDPSRRSRAEEQERMYMEDVEAQKMRGYDTTDLDSLQRHEIERDSDIPHPGYRQRSDTRYIEPDANEDTAVREQHFYREGNAEVLRLVTRGQVDDTTVSRQHHHHHHHHPTTLVVDGKDIILRRFMDDQKSRHELSMQDLEAARSMESHQRSKEVFQQQSEIILIPERLELGQRQHVDELGPNVQRLVIDHGDYDRVKTGMKDPQAREMSYRQERPEGMTVGAASISERATGVAKEHVQSSNMPSYSFHDLELARQNALLTRLLLERENRHVSRGVVDSTSYLETQSLPGQVAIATQTEKTAATQTDRQVRSRSDNDESDEDSRHRKKLKSKKRYGDGDWKRTRTLWMKSPIEEEGSPCFDKRLSILRKKVREVKEGRKASLEPNVLREISDSLDGNGSSYIGEEEESTRMYKKSMEQTSIRYKILNEEKNGSQSSTENGKDKCEKVYSEKIYESTIDAHKADTTESTSSPELRGKHEKHVHGKMDDRSPKKDSKTKPQRKADGMAKPSFRILEREITMLTKKLSKLGDRKQQESTGSDSTSQEKPGPMSKDSSKDFDQKSTKRSDVPGSRAQKPPSGFTPGTSKTSLTEQNASQRKEAAIAKTRQKLKYQQAQVMSAGSSEYEDRFEKSRKQASGFVQEASKQKQPASGQTHVKLKRQAQVERRESKKQMSQSSDQEVSRQKDSTKETLQTDTKVEKTVKSVTRAPKLAVISHRENVSEEPDTSTSSDRVQDKKTSTATDNKSNTDTSGNDTDGFNMRKSSRVMEQISQRFSDHFVEDSIESTRGSGSVPPETKETKETKDKSIKHEEVPDPSSAVKPPKCESMAEKKTEAESTKVHQQIAPKIGEGSILLYDIAKEQMENNEVPVETKKEENDLFASTAGSVQKDDKINAVFEQEVRDTDKRQEKEDDDRFPNEIDTDSRKTDVDKREVGTAERSKAGTENIVVPKLTEHLENDALLSDVKSGAEKFSESKMETDEGKDELLHHTKTIVNEEMKEIQGENEAEEASVDDSETQEQHKSEDETETDISMKRSLSEDKLDIKEEQETELKDDVQKMVIAHVNDQDATFLLDDNKDDEMQHTEIEEKHTASDLPIDREGKVDKIMAETIKKEVEDHISEIDKSDDHTAKREESTEKNDQITFEEKEDTFKPEEDTALDENIAGKCEQDTPVPEEDIVKQEEIVTELKENTPKVEEDDTRDDESNTHDEDAIEHEKDTTKDEAATSTSDADATTSKEDDETTTTTQEQPAIEHKEDTPETEKDVIKHEESITEHEVDVTKLEKDIAENKDEIENTIKQEEDSPKLEEDTPGDENVKVEKDVLEHDDNTTIREDVPEHEESVTQTESDTIQQGGDTTKSVATVAGSEKSPVTAEPITDQKVPEADDVSEEPIKESPLPVDKKDSHHDTISQMIPSVPSSDDTDKKDGSSCEISPPEIKTESPHWTEEELQEKGAERVKDDKETEILTDDSAVGSIKDEIKEEAINYTDANTIPRKEVELKDNAISVEILDDKITVEQATSSEFSSDKQVTALEKSVDPVHKGDGFSDKAEVSAESSVLEKSSKPEETPDDKKTESPKVEAETAEMKSASESEATKTDDDLHISESLPTSKVTVEKSPESEAVTPIVPSEHEEQLKLESKKSKLEEVRKFIEEQTFVEEEDNGQHFDGEQLPRQENLRKSFVDEPRMQDVLPGQTDKASHPEEKVIMEKSVDDELQREYSDVSLPLFTSTIDTLDDSDESDSSSDISRKTTLTTRPYQTPRHRARTSPEKDSNGRTENADLKSLESDDQADLAIELPEDKTVELSKDGKEIVTTEDIDNAPSTSDVKHKTERDGNTESKEQTKSSTSTENPLSFQRVLTAGNLRRTYQRKSLDSKSSLALDEGSRSNIRRHSNNVKAEPRSKDRGRGNTKGASPSVSDIQRAKGDPSKSTEGKTKPPEKMRTSQRDKKQSPPDKTSEEKSVRPQDKPRPRQRSQKQAASDSTKNREDPGKSKVTDHRQQSRGSVNGSQRKQSLSKLKVEKERKSSSSGEKSASPPKTGEIDTSKAQPKYMAWYKKKQEEAAKKRAEAKTADDDEQLPRWVRRSMRKKFDKTDKKKPDHKTPEGTPQMRRKVKPLVNVESEQLKAIVRQGRKLRKAEGGTNEDPPVQIFATTPPAAPPPPQQDAKHRLVQHSEYKYEKVPPPFYLHQPPPPPHPSPQLSPERFESQPTMECRHHDESLDSGITVSLQGGSRLRHQQLLEKKSVFDIAYNEAAPSQLRADSTTPPS